MPALPGNAPGHHRPGDAGRHLPEYRRTAGRRSQYIRRLRRYQRRGARLHAGGTAALRGQQPFQDHQLPGRFHPGGCCQSLHPGVEAGLQRHHRVRHRLPREGRARDRFDRRCKKPTTELAVQPDLWQESKKPRPRSLRGSTFSIETPLGKAFVTINENGGGQPFEVFVNTAKAGSDTAAVSEAIGRLISYTLRLASPVEARARLQEVFRQLAGIGGGRSLGFGPNRVRSLPDGVARALDEYLTERDEYSEGEVHEVTLTPMPLEQSMLKIGDLCPECGQAAVVNEEGCRKCYSCGFSEC